MAEIDKTVQDLAAQNQAGHDEATSLHGPEGKEQPTAATPAAGAHAAGHLTNDDATPGSGVLTSRAHASGKEVDGGAG